MNRRILYTSNFRRVLRLIFTIFLIIVIIHVLGKAVTIDSLEGASFATIDAYNSLPEDSLDVIGYGSSHMMSSLNSKLLWDEYGLRTYNYGNNWQRMDTTLLFLKESLKTQHPKVIIIETYMLGLSNKISEINGEVYYTRALPESVDKMKYLYQRFGHNLDLWLGYYVPLCAFHDNWTSMKLFHDSESKLVDEYLDSMGQSKVDAVQEIELDDYQTFEQKKFDADTYAILDEIMAVCSEENIKVIFITTPMAEHYSYFDATKGYAESHGCQYVNFFELVDELGIDEKADFYDNAHLNASGSEKISRYLGKMISKEIE